MKKLLLVLCLALFLNSCQNSNEYDSDENWIKINNISPDPNSSIDWLQEISFEIEYNISESEIEGNGFMLFLYSEVDNDGYWSSNIHGRLYKRNDKIVLITDMPDHSHNRDTRSLKLRVDIDRIKDNDFVDELCSSKVVKYYINPEQ